MTTPEYELICDAAYSECLRIRDAAYTECLRVRNAAYAECERIRDAAFELATATEEKENL